MYPFEVIMAGLNPTGKKFCPICGDLMDAEDQKIMGGCIDCLRRREWEFEVEEHLFDDKEEDQ